MRKEQQGNAPEKPTLGTLPKIQPRTRPADVSGGQSSTGLPFREPPPPTQQQQQQQQAPSGWTQQQQPYLGVQPQPGSIPGPTQQTLARMQQSLPPQFQDFNQSLTQQQPRARMNHQQPGRPSQPPPPGPAFGLQQPVSSHTAPAPLTTQVGSLPTGPGMQLSTYPSQQVLAPAQRLQQQHPGAAAYPGPTSQLQDVGGRGVPEPATQTARQPIPLQGPAEPLYGFALELAQSAAGVNPLSIRPPVVPVSGSAAARRQATSSARRALGGQLDRAGASASGLFGHALGGATRPPPPGTDNWALAMPGVVTEVVPPGAEPDYGIVAELRQGSMLGSPGAKDQIGRTGSFGLAAEVARRRARPLEGPGGANFGGALAARPRKRLAAGEGAAPADFGLAQELAARAAAAEQDRMDPFNSANRASHADPFIMADDLLKFPTAPYMPPLPSEQTLPQGEVDVKVPGIPQASDPSLTNRVRRDSVEYGLAEELGVDPVEARRRRRAAQDAAAGLMPPHLGPLLGYDEGGQPILAPGPPPDFYDPAAQYPLKYVYNEDTGLLLPPEGMEGDGGKEARQYVEDAATGNFFRINHEGLFRRIMNRFKRHAPADSDAPQEDDLGWDPDAGKGRGRLRTTVRRVAAAFSLLGIFVQGLLGGFALLNFFMTYFLYSGSSFRNWLKYYSPLALANNRIYYTLITLSVIASSARLARDQLRSQKRVPVVDIAQLLLYCLAYLFSILCTPLDDELTYEYDRNPRFYDLSFSSGFKQHLNTWAALNVVRTVCAGLGWLLCCYQHSPYVSNDIIRFEVQEEIKRLTRPKPHMSPVMLMATPPSDLKRHPLPDSGAAGNGDLPPGSPTSANAAGRAGTELVAAPTGKRTLRALRLAAGSASDTAVGQTFDQRQGAGGAANAGGLAAAVGLPPTASDGAAGALGQGQRASSSSGLAVAAGLPPGFHDSLVGGIGRRGQRASRPQASEATGTGAAWGAGVDSTSRVPSLGGAPSIGGAPSLQPGSGGLAAVPAGGAHVGAGSGGGAGIAQGAVHGVVAVPTVSAIQRFSETDSIQPVQPGAAVASGGAGLG